MGKFLIGERIYLRPLEKEDLDKILEWINDPEIRHLTLREELPLNRSKGEEFFEKITKDMILFGICLNNDKLIGTLSLMLQLRSATFGITIGDKAHWNKGYGTEATKIALDYCFNTLNLHRVGLWVFEFNEKAIHCYEKLGFKKEGISREAVYKNGRYWNSVDMGILKEEWNAKVTDL
jgi:Acetyltransferases, including N-acetylases of ribosomal proteins